MPSNKIKVTPEIIQASIRSNSSHCMIAEAVREAIPEAKLVSVDLATIRYSHPGTGKRYTFFTPGVAQRALLMFDAGKQMEPFDFLLSKPCQVNTVGLKSRKTPEEQAKEKLRRIARKNAATAKRTSSNGSGIITKEGGDPLPTGPLSSTHRKMTGQRREYGLRAMGRA